MSDEQKGSVFTTWYRVMAYIYDQFLWLLMLPVGGVRDFRERFLDLVDPKPGDRIAELCCGPDSLTLLMAPMVKEPRIVASDLSPDQIRVAKWKARRKGIDIDFSVQDATHTSYPSSAFDKVVISGALHEIKRDSRREIYREVQRLLKPHSFFYVVEPDRPEGGWGLVCHSIGFFPGHPERKTTLELTEGKLERELSEAGFEVGEKRFARFGICQMLRSSKR